MNTCTNLNYDIEEMSFDNAINEQVNNDENQFALENYEDFKTTSMITEKEKEKLAEENIRLVYSIASKYLSTRIDFEDLKSVAFTGYEKALTRFDPARGEKFSTYAYKCIENEIRGLLRKEKTKITKSVSLSSPCSQDKNGKDLEIQDFIPSKDIPLDEHVASQEIRGILNEIIKNDLTSKEQTIITGRFGFGKDLMTQNELAVLTGMSQANISKKEKRTLMKIRKILVSRYHIDSSFREQ